jgi:CrcB protein
MGMRLSALQQALLVGAGGFFGSILRYTISGFVQRVLPLSGFPSGTLVVNIVGCLGIGILSGLAESRQIISPETRLFLVIGLLGGFTTFSTFAYEGFEMLRDGELAKMIANVTAQVVVGCCAVWLGHAMTGVR